MFPFCQGVIHDHLVFEAVDDLEGRGFQGEPDGDLSAFTQVLQRDFFGIDGTYLVQDLPALSGYGWFIERTWA